MLKTVGYFFFPRHIGIQELTRLSVRYTLPCEQNTLILWFGASNTYGIMYIPFVVQNWLHGKFNYIKRGRQSQTYRQTIHNNREKAQTETNKRMKASLWIFIVCLLSQFHFAFILLLLLFVRSFVSFSSGSAYYCIIKTIPTYILSTATCLFIYLYVSTITKTFLHQRKWL